ncbi:LPD1 domain-containing protein [Acinetobacter baumannii]
MIEKDDQDSNDYIGDIGEKFEGAKKDLAIHLNFTTNNSVNQITKKILWPRPNFREDVKSGLNSSKHAVLFMIVYENLSNKPLDDGWFNLTSSHWEEAYKYSVEFLKNAYENGHYESIDILRNNFNDYIKTRYPRSNKDIERYAAGKTARRKVTHPLSLDMESRLRLDSLEALGWLEDEDILDSDNYGACILVNTVTNKKAWFAVKSATPKKVRTLDGWTEFSNFEDAMAQAKKIFEKEVLVGRKNKPKQKKERTKPPVRPCFDRPYIRQGPDYRNGEPITVETFADTFKFRGVEFGNWVTQSERQGFIDATYDAFMDLTRIFGLPPTFASLGGTLGIAFGSRGKGDSAAAHFELDQWLIHLTKTKGVGSLSHEFGHALDAYLARRNKIRSKFLSDEFIYSIKDNRTFLREEARQIRNLKDQAMVPDYFNLMQKIVFKNYNGSLSKISNYTSNAARLDSPTKKLYWAEPTELFARAFESWISDRLCHEGQINEFLVYGTDQAPSNWNAKVNMYPESEEREKIVSAMETWIQSLVSGWTTKINKN